MDNDTPPLKNLLTIILPVKSRPDYLWRWLDYAANDGYSCNVLIADGSADNQIQTHLEARSIPSNIQYIRFPHDLTWSHYYSKMLSASKLVETPFVLLSDVDDFFCHEGLIKAVQFLRENLDYSAAMGQIGYLELNAVSGLGNPLRLIKGQSDGYESPDPIERISEYLEGKKSGPYYSVFRTPMLVDIWEFVVKSEIKDIRLPELLIDLTALSVGKVKRLPHLTYYRQFGIDVGNESDCHHDTVIEMLDSKFSGDFHKVIEYVCLNFLYSKLDLFQLKVKVAYFMYPRILAGMNIDKIDKNNPAVLKKFIVRYLMLKVPILDFLFTKTKAWCRQVNTEKEDKIVSFVSSYEGREDQL